jgi:hypothetical protein
MRLMLEKITDMFDAIYSCSFEIVRPWRARNVARQDLGREFAAGTLKEIPLNHYDVLAANLLYPPNARYQGTARRA